MPATATTLIPSTTNGTATGNYDGSSTWFYSDAAKGDGFYGYSDGLHTVSWQITDFVGKITIQASLVETPVDDAYPDTPDWFDVVLVDPAGTASGTTQTYSSSTSSQVAFNFTGNFVNVRASISDWTAGSINKLRFNY